MEPAINQSVEKTAAVLSAFRGERSELRVSDVAEVTGLGQSSTSRLLGSLEAVGFVERDAVSSLYRLGPALVTLGGVAINQHPVHRAARQRAQDLAASTGLGANVSVLRDWTMFYLCNFEGKLAGRAFTMMGLRNPLHCTGMGKCLLLATSGAMRREALGQLSRFTPHTITDHDELDATIRNAETRGYATEVEELALGRACIAAPIRDRSGNIVAALSLSGALTVLDLTRRERELATAVIETADLISVALGYVTPPMPQSDAGSVL